MRYKRLPKSVTRLGRNLNPLKLNTNQLINRVFFIFVPILLGFSLLFSFYSSQRALEASQRLKDTNEALVAINEAQERDLKIIRKDIKDLKQSLLCVAQFFSTEDRENLKIATYDPCTLTTQDPDEPVSFSTQQSSPQSDSGPHNEVRSSSNDTSSAEESKPDNSQPVSEPNRSAPAPSEEPEPSFLQQILNWFGGIL